MFNDDAYLDAVSEAFKKLSEAQTSEQLKDVLENWPEKEDYFVKNEEEIEDINNESENL